MHHWVHHSSYSQMIYTCILENNEQYARWKLTEFDRTLHKTLIQLTLTIFNHSYIPRCEWCLNTRTVWAETEVSRRAELNFSARQFWLRSERWFWLVITGSRITWLIVSVTISITTGYRGAPVCCSAGTLREITVRQNRRAASATSLLGGFRYMLTQRELREMHHMHRSMSANLLPSAHLQEVEGGARFSNALSYKHFIPSTLKDRGLITQLKDWSPLYSTADYMNVKMLTDQRAWHRAWEDK